VLGRDDGVGIAAIARLARLFRAAPGLTVIDATTPAQFFVPLLEDAEAAILAGAIQANAAPGTLVRLEGRYATQAAAHRLSLNRPGAADPLERVWIRSRLPPRLVFLGVVRASAELGATRTPAVEAALPALVKAIAQEAAALGYVMFRRRESDLHELRTQ
jgi:hydrogenase maturation protease